MDFVNIVALKDQILNGVALKKGDTHLIPKILYEQLAMNSQELVAIVVSPLKEDFSGDGVESHDFSNE